MSLRRDCAYSGIAEFRGITRANVDRCRGPVGNVHVQRRRRTETVFNVAERRDAD